jgi:hypothetical protein
MSGAMVEKESETVPILCQGVSKWDEPCLSVATNHCEQCGGWFCHGHFLDPEWHPCVEELQ